MAHFAKIDSNNKVETVIVAPDQAYVDSLGGRWIQTSYNTLAGVHYDPITGQHQLQYQQFGHMQQMKETMKFLNLLIGTSLI